MDELLSIEICFVFAVYLDIGKHAKTSCVASLSTEQENKLFVGIFVLGGTDSCFFLNGQLLSYFFEFHFDKCFQIFRERSRSFPMILSRAYVEEGISSHTIHIFQTCFKIRYIRPPAF